VIRRLQYRPVDYKVIVNMFEGHGSRAILSRIIDGKDVLSFFQDGTMTLTDLNLSFGDCKNLKVTVQILRMIDHKVLHIFQEQEEGPEDYGDYILFGFDCHHLEFRDYDYSRRLSTRYAAISSVIKGLAFL